MLQPNSYMCKVPFVMYMYLGGSIFVSAYKIPILLFSKKNIW